MNILWLESVECDLVDLTNSIAEDNPKSSLQIFNIIRQSIEKLASYPTIGREGRIGQTRELVISQLPYIVVYIIAKEIRILAILHTSRKWPHTFVKQ